MQPWRIPRTKNGDWHIVPLTERAVAVLNNRPGKGKSDWVFVGKDPSKHIVEPKRGWYALLEAAVIKISASKIYAERCEAT